MKHYRHIIFVFFTTILVSHPPISLIVDSKNNIYYSDLSNIWVIKPDGTKKIVIRGVHTHQMWISKDDVLFGEDVQNEGDNYRSRIWSFAPNGELKNEIPWGKTLPNYASVIRDNNGNSYVLNKSKREINVYNKTRFVRTIDLGEFKDYLHWHSLNQNGDITVTIGDKLILVQNTTMKVVAEGLVSRTKQFNFVHDRHALMGHWHDSSNNIFVPVFTGQEVKKVTPSGKVTTYFKSKENWSIVGGTFDTNDNMLILEFSTNNQIRVRQFLPDGSTKIL